MQDTKAILIPDATYHIYNRANGDEQLFLSDANYRYFLTKYQQYINPIADTYCYCLMPNHFHFLVRVKEFTEIETLMLNVSAKSKTLQGFQTLGGLDKETAMSKYLTQQFSHFLNGYTQAFNKQHERKGSLLMRSYKRKRVTNDHYFRQLVLYIHQNPVTAGMSKQLTDWPYTSYNQIISEKITTEQQAMVVTYFNDVPNCIVTHQQNLSGLDFD